MQPIVRFADSSPMEPPSRPENRVGRRDSPILDWFRANVVPVGGAPVEIRQGWLGVPLPVRDPRPVEGPLPYVGIDVVDRTVRRAINDGVAVRPDDALHMLRLFDRTDAADWWEKLWTNRATVKSLLFRRAEGDLLPPTLAKMLYPELHNLDDS